MKIKSFLILLISGLIFTVWSCKKEPIFQGEHDPEVIKTYKNKSLPVSKMDSLASVNFITRQKLTELYELTSLYSANSSDSLLREILYPQIKSYFLEKDTVNIPLLLREMDSLRVNFVEISDLKLIEMDSLTADSIKKVRYGVRYFSNDKRLIDSLEKSAIFILKKKPIKFKHEFIFYFSDLEPIQKVEKDTISSAVTQ